MTEPALCLKGYSLSLEGRVILRDLSFSIEPGERVAVIGPNGAGKSTLLKCLNRIRRGGRGEIRVAGRPLESYRQFELARLLAYVPQADGRTATCTVREMVEMARYPHLGPLASVRPEDTEAVEQALAETGMIPLAGRLVETLSGGEFQKVLLAAALAQHSRILLLDEPTASLDPFQQAEILGVLARVQRERGTTMVTVTHDLNEAVACSERVIALREGDLVYDGPAAKLAEDRTLWRIYQHEFLLGSHPGTGRPVFFSR